MHRPGIILCFFLLFGVGTYAADEEIYTSPNGELAIATAPSSVPNRYKVQLVDATTRHVLGSYDPEVRAIQVFWSPDGRFAAINEDISHATSHLSIWCVADNRWEPVHLPQRLRDRIVIDDPKTQTGHSQEVIDRLLSSARVPPVKFWHGAHQPSAEKWITKSDLQINIEAAGESQDGRDLTVGYRFIVRCSRDCTAKIVEEKRLTCEIKELGK